MGRIGCQPQIEFAQPLRSDERSEDPADFERITIALDWPQDAEFDCLGDVSIQSIRLLCRIA